MTLLDPPRALLDPRPGREGPPAPTDPSGGLRRRTGGRHAGDDWLGPLTDVDRRVLDRVCGPALDVGCGPARHTLALASRGIPALGIDITPALLDLARTRWAPVLERDVFGHVPGEGRWETVLLLDGNLGLGGDPTRLLCRAAELLGPTGVVLAEVVTEAVAPDHVQVDVGGSTGPWFGWAPPCARELHALLPVTPFRCEEAWIDSGRSFVLLARRGGAVR